MTELDITSDERQVLASLLNEEHSLSSREWERAFYSARKKGLVVTLPGEASSTVTPEGLEAVKAFDCWLLSVSLTPSELEALKSAYGRNNSLHHFTTAERMSAWEGLQEKGLVYLYGTEFRITPLGKKRLLARNVVRITTRPRSCLPT